MKATQFPSSILDSEMPVDASLRLVSLHFQGLDIPAERILVEEALLRQLWEKPLKSTKSKESIAMGTSINYGGRVVFALLLWMSLAVACTAGGSPPSAGEPTLSPNAGSMMSVVPPEGGTPVPMNLFTPVPATGQAKTRRE